MATLSGQTIANTYQGLLKLDDSSQGVTSTLQPLQDGLGNNVGGAEYNDELFKTTSNFYLPEARYKFQYYGTGLGNNVYEPVSDLYYIPDQYSTTALYDMGLWSYSAMTFWVNQTGTIGDPNIFQLALYDATLSPTLGIIPNNRLTPVITLDPSTAVGFYNIPFGYDIKITTGFYFLVLSVYNGGVLPTFKPRSQGNNTFKSMSSSMLGYSQATGSTFTNVFASVTGSASSQNLSAQIYNNLGFPSQYTENDLINTRTVGNTGGFETLGYLLNTVI